VCGAVRFPSILHSGQSFDNLRLTQGVLADLEAEVEGPDSKASTSQLPKVIPKVSFSVATPLYFSPSLRNGEVSGLEPLDLVTTALRRTPSESGPQPPINSKYSPTSPQPTSPGSEFSLEESTTSSIHYSPFHWDTILAGLSPSPVLPAALTERFLPKSSAPNSPVPPAALCHDPVTAQGSTYDSITSPSMIPTIVVLNPDSVMVPAQASVSSIIGLYDARCESAHAAAREMQIPEPQASKETPEFDLYEDESDRETSSPESEFDISETNEIDVENAFGSLMVRYL
jgi:hypothetical protein